MTTPIHPCHKHHKIIASCPFCMAWWHAHKH